MTSRARGVDAGRRRVCGAIAATLLAPACRSRTSASPAVLRIALQGEPSTLDPHLQDDVITHSILFNVYEALTAFDGDMRLQPALATDWHSRDELTWVFVLRPGVRFHDGRELAAEDVVASLERARHVPASRTSGYLVGLRQVRMTAPGTIEIVTWKPHALLAKKLAFVAILPRDAPQEIRHPVGTGAYRFAERAGGVVRLERSGSYWGPPAAYERVEMRSLPGGPQREKALAEGEVDVVMNLDAAAVESLGRMRGVRVMTRPTLSVTYVGLRCDRPPFSDVRLRQAVSLALDREALTREWRRGLARPTSQIVDRAVFGFDPSLPVVGRDLAGARRLLAAAGHAGGIDVTLEHREGLDAAAVVAQLAEAGVRARAVARPWAEVLARLESSGVEMYLGGVLCPSGDSSDVLELVLHSRDEATGYGSGNHWGYANRALDELVERAVSTFDQAQRLLVLQEAIRLTARELPLVPLLVPFNAAAARDGIAWQPRVDGLLRASEARPSA